MLTLLLLAALGYGGYRLWKHFRDKEIEQELLDEAEREAAKARRKELCDKWDRIARTETIPTRAPVAVPVASQTLDPWKKTPTPIPSYTPPPKKEEPKKRYDDTSDSLTGALIGAAIGSMISSSSRSDSYSGSSSSSSDWGSSSSSSSNDSYSSGGGDSGGGGSSSDF